MRRPLSTRLPISKGLLALLCLLCGVFGMALSVVGLYNAFSLQGYIQLFSGTPAGEFQRYGKLLEETLKDLGADVEHHRTHGSLHNVILLADGRPKVAVAEVSTLVLTAPNSPFAPPARGHQTPAPGQSLYRVRVATQLYEEAIYIICNRNWTAPGPTGSAAEPPESTAPKSTAKSTNKPITVAQDCDWSTILKAIPQGYTYIGMENSGTRLVGKTVLGHLSKSKVDVLQSDRTEMPTAWGFSKAAAALCDGRLKAGFFLVRKGSLHDENAEWWPQKCAAEGQLELVSITEDISELFRGAGDSCELVPPPGFAKQGRRSATSWCAPALLLAGEEVSVAIIREVLRAIHKPKSGLASFPGIPKSDEARDFLRKSCNSGSRLRPHPGAEFYYFPLSGWSVPRAYLGLVSGPDYLWALVLLLSLACLLYGYYERARPVRIFISFQNEEREKLFRLKKSFVTCSRSIRFVDETTFNDRTGSVGERIDRYMLSSDIVIIMLSPDYEASEWCQVEREKAYLLQSKRCVPVVHVYCRKLTEVQRARYRDSFLFPRSGPIDGFQADSEAWFEVVEGILECVRREQWPFRSVR